MPRVSKPAAKTRHDPLHVQLEDHEVLEKFGRVSQPGKRRKSRNNVPDDEPGEVSDLDLCHSALVDNVS